MQYDHTESSIVDTTVFNKWMRHFCAQLPPGKHLLVLDGHVSHISYETISYANDNRLLIFQLPSHTSHQLQPLDVCAFDVAKQRYTKELERFYRTNMRTPDKRDMSGIIHTVLAHTMTPANIKSTFAGDVLSPFDQDISIQRLHVGASRKRK